MLDSALAALASLTQPSLLLMLAAGVVAGLVIGLIPGLGGTGKPFIRTGGIWVHGSGDAITENRACREGRTPKNGSVAIMKGRR